MKHPITKAAVSIRLSILIIALAGIFSSGTVKAQVNVNVNISSQCLWGPVGYDYVEYYYLPEVDAFYYVSTGQFVYWRGNQYIFASSLPYQVNLFNTYKVVVNQPKPYLQHNVYVVKYKKFKHGGPKQMMIRESNDQKYYAVKGHPKHGQGNSNGKNNGGGNNMKGNNDNNYKSGGMNKSGNGGSQHKSGPSSSPKQNGGGQQFKQNGGGGGQQSKQQGGGGHSSKQNGGGGKKGH